MRTALCFHGSAGQSLSESLQCHYCTCTTIYTTRPSTIDRRPSTIDHRPYTHHTPTIHHTPYPYDALTFKCTALLSVTLHSLSFYCPNSFTSNQPPPRLFLDIFNHYQQLYGFIVLQQLVCFANN